MFEIIKSDFVNGASHYSKQHDVPGAQGPQRHGTQMAFPIALLPKAKALASRNSQLNPLSPGQRPHECVAPWTMKGKDEIWSFETEIQCPSFGYSKHKPYITLYVYIYTRYLKIYNTVTASNMFNLPRCKNNKMNKAHSIVTCRCLGVRIGITHRHETIDFSLRHGRWKGSNHRYTADRVNSIITYPLVI